MGNKIIIIAGSLRCYIGKKSEEKVQGHDAVNVFTNFEPLSKPLFLLSLRDSAVVSRIANTAYYGPGDGGGLTIYLANDKTEADLAHVLGKLLKTASEGLIE